MGFTKATKKSAKVKIGMAGPSGSGKTYSALKMAEGLGKRIALIDTERGSSELYADEVDFDVLQLTPPFSPQKYTDALRLAEKEGYDVIIVDSMSHAWTGDGGMLDMQDRAAKVTKNSFTAWKEVTPHHNRLIDTILQVGAHVIVTARTKTAYELQDRNGKKVPVKVGLAPVFRDGLEYEMTIFFDLNIEDNIASASKDRTGLFQGQYFTLNKGHGELIKDWIESGVVAENFVKATNDQLRQLEKIGKEKGYESVKAFVSKKLGRQIVQGSDISLDEAERIIAES